MSGAGVRAGRAYVELTMLDKTQASLTKASARLKGFSKSVGTIGAGLLAGAGALAAPLIPAIRKASQYQEVMSKFDTVFGDQSADVKNWSDTFAGEVGRSKREISGFMASSQDLFVPLGFDSGSATELSKTITGLAIDLASFNEEFTDEQAMNHLQAALTGSGEVMKNYGVVLDEAGVKQELLNKGIDPKAATNQQKVQARLNVILAGTTKAQGDAVATSGSFANQMKRLEGVIDDTQVAIGTALLPALTSIVSRVGSVVAWVGNWISENPAIVQGIAAFAAGLAIAGSILTTVAGAAWVLGTVASGLASVVGGVAIAVGLLVSPIGLAIAGIVGLIAAGLAWTGSWGAIVDFFSGTLGAMGDALANGDLALAGEILWSSLGVAFAAGTRAIRQVWDATWAGMSAMMGSVVTSLRQVWSGFTSGLASVWSSLQGAFSQVTTGIGNAWRATWSGVTTMMGSVVASLQEKWSSLVAWFGQGSFVIRQLWGVAWAGMSSITGSVVASLQQMWSSFTSGLAEVTTGIGNVWSETWTGMSAILGSVVTSLQEMWSSFTGGITGTLATLWTEWTGSWGAIVDFFSGTLGAMGNALANGELALAGEILWSSLKVAFMQGTLAIRQAWLETWAGMSSIMDSVITSLNQMWISFTTGVAGTLLKLWNKIQGLFGGTTIDIEATLTTLKEDQARKSQGVEAARQTRDDARGAQLQQDMQGLAALESELSALKAAREARVENAGGETFTGTGSVIDSLNGLLKDATLAGQPTVGSQTPNPAAAPQSNPDGSPKRTPDVTGGVEAASKVAGTFSSSAAGLMGGSVMRVDERTAKAAEKTADEVRELRREIRTGGGLVYGA